MNRRRVVEPLESRTYFAALTFAKATQVPVGAGPVAIVTADFNGDGRADAATADFAAGAVSVLLGNGNGTFAPAVSYAVGASPEALAVGDFNGDGHPDLVVADEGTNAVTVLLGTGDGTFAPAATYAVGTRPEAVVVTDLNGDGHPDVVTANEGSNTVSVLMGNGDGTFAAAASVGAGVDPDTLAAGDLNGDGHPDLVVGNPSVTQLNVLTNTGTGTFRPAIQVGVDGAVRSVAVADVNNDGRPDLVTANLRSANITLVLNGGNLDGMAGGDPTFQPTQMFNTGAFPFSVTIADLIGNGRQDVIVADSRDNNIGVLRRTQDGTFAKALGFRTGLAGGGVVGQGTQNGGTAPEGVAVADFNGDGRPDMLAANFNINSVGVLLNTSPVLPLVATTLTLTPGQNPVQVGNRLVLSARVAPAAASAFAPTGVVQFFDGARVIGIGKIRADGAAQITTTKLALGDQTLTAYFGGTDHFSGSSAPAVLESVVTSTLATPLVAATTVALVGRTTFVPGDQGTVAVTLTNGGAGVARGAVAVALTAVPSDPALPPISLGVVGSGQVSVNLVGGTSRTSSVKFTLPGDLAAGSYTVTAALAPARTLTVAQVATTTVTTATAATVSLQFGTVATHRNYVLTRTLSNGSRVTFRLSGLGTGTVADLGNGAVTLQLVGTTAGSTVTLDTTGTVALQTVFDPAALGGIIAPNVTLAGSGTVGGSLYMAVGLRRLTLAGVTDSAITIGPIGTATFSLGTVVDSSMNCLEPMTLLAVNSWTATSADGVSTPSIRTLTSAGDFGASLAISGANAPGHLAIRQATIGGAVGPSTWTIDSNVGALQVGGVAAGFTAGITASLASLLDTGGFAGTLAALSIGTVDVRGDLSGGTLLAGATLGADAHLGGGDDTFAAGRISSLTVGGNVIASLVAAGLQPADDNPFNATGGTLLRGGVIDRLSVAGPVDATSRFLAAHLPASVTLASVAITTTSDPRFTP